MLVKIRSNHSWQFFYGALQEDYVSTIEDSYKCPVQVESEMISLEVIDTGGDPDLKCLRDQWCQGGDAFIIAFSSASRCSFDSVQLFERQIAQHHPQGYPLALVATKTDLKQEVSYEEGKRRADELGAAYFHLSVQDSKRVQQPFTYLARHFMALDSKDPPNPASAALDARLGLTSGAWTWAWVRSAIGPCMGWAQG